MAAVIDEKRKRERKDYIQERRGAGQNTSQSQEIDDCDKNRGGVKIELYFKDLFILGNNLCVSLSIIEQGKAEVNAIFH